MENEKTPSFKLGGFMVLDLVPDLVAGGGWDDGHLEGGPRLKSGWASPTMDQMLE